MKLLAGWIPRPLGLVLLAGLAAACGDGPAGQGRLSAYACLTDEGCSQRLVAAHRGYHRQAPENSLAALRAAAGLGVDLVEVDPRHTADGVLVLMHDGEVDRTTDGQGAVESLSWAEIQELTLDGCDPADAESCRVPRFDEALALAAELGVMLYVDQKTDRWDLVLEAVAAGDFYQTALVRDDWPTLAEMLAADPELLVMPPVSTTIDFEYVRGQDPGPGIVEYAEAAPSAEMTAAIHQAGIRVQQDVMAWGDVKALVGDYTGWRDFIEAGVDLLQTDQPQLLVPALRQWESTGEFPAEGEPAL